MSKTLAEIAQQLKDTDKKVQLIYAFNGTGKTRRSDAGRHWQDWGGGMTDKPPYTPTLDEWKRTSPAIRDYYGWTWPKEILEMLNDR